MKHHLQKALLLGLCVCLPVLTLAACTDGKKEGDGETTKDWRGGVGSYTDTDNDAEWVDVK